MIPNIAAKIKGARGKIVKLRMDSSRIGFSSVTKCPSWKHSAHRVPPESLRGHFKSAQGKSGILPRRFPNSPSTNSDFSLDESGNRPGPFRKRPWTNPEAVFAATSAPPRCDKMSHLDAPVPVLEGWRVPLAEEDGSLWRKRAGFWAAGCPLPVSGSSAAGRAVSASPPAAEGRTS